MSCFTSTPTQYFAKMIDKRKLMGVVYKLHMRNVYHKSCGVGCTLYVLGPASVQFVPGVWHAKWLTSCGLVLGECGACFTNAFVHVKLKFLPL